MQLDGYIVQLIQLNGKWCWKKTQNGTNLDLEDDDITDELLPKPRLKKHFQGWGGKHDWYHDRNVCHLKFRTMAAEIGKEDDDDDDAYMMIMMLMMMMMRLYLPGKVEALPTEIGEPGLGEGGRWDHWTRPDNFKI